jgi:hypothetical protein
MKVLLTAVLGLFVSVNSWAMILPPNNLAMFDRVELIADPVKEKQFNDIIDHVIEMWKPMARANGANLTVEKRWSDSTVNAYAQQMGSTWKVTMFGGLFRRPEVTPDGFAMVVCHELGHHFAGYAFYDSGEWAASEGQSDYWATQICGRKIFEKTNNTNFRFSMRTGASVPPYVQERCDTTWKTPAEQERCYRLSAAGLSLATLLGSLGENKVPKFETPDTSKVSRTQPAHPKAQCRLDTYFNGALCPIGNPNLNVIPGKGSNGGDNSITGEMAAAQVSCMASRKQVLGARPACWFKEQSADFVGGAGFDSWIR